MLAKVNFSFKVVKSPIYYSGTIGIVRGQNVDLVIEVEFELRQCQEIFCRERNTSIIKFYTSVRLYTGHIRFRDSNFI